MSLFRTSGGKTCSKRLPSDAEGLALAVGTAMQWVKLRDCSNPQFFRNVASECKRLKCTPSVWTHEEMTWRKSSTRSRRRASSATSRVSGLEFVVRATCCRSSKILSSRSCTSISRRSTRAPTTIQRSSSRRYASRTRTMALTAALSDPPQPCGPDRARYV